MKSIDITKGQYLITFDGVSLAIIATVGATLAMHKIPELTQ